MSQSKLQSTLDAIFEPYVDTQSYYLMKQDIMNWLPNKKGMTITADNLHDLWPDEKMTPILGLILRNLAKEGILKKVRGIDGKPLKVNSQRRTCHYRPDLCVFEVV